MKQPNCCNHHGPAKDDDLLLDERELHCEKEDRKPSGEGAQVKTTLQTQDDNGTKNVNIFDITSVSPTSANKKNSFGTNAFAIEATDGVASQNARPIGRHESSAACGFKLVQIKTLTGETDANADAKWKEVFTKLKETSRTHTWAPTSAALRAAKIEEATQRTTSLRQNEINKNAAMKTIQTDTSLTNTSLTAKR
jgi:hypothetical protein